MLQTKQDCSVIKNNELSIDQIFEINPSAIVISPGPGIPQDAGLTMQIISIFKNKIPILGICLGHQAIGLTFGLDLKRAILPIHGKVDICIHHNHWVFNGLPSSFQIMRYHSLILHENNQNLSEVKVIASNSNGEIMAIAHKYLPIVGLQFHPESILTPYGRKIVFNFVDMVMKNINE